MASEVVPEENLKLQQPNGNSGADQESGKKRRIWRKKGKCCGGANDNWKCWIYIITPAVFFISTIISIIVAAVLIKRPNCPSSDPESCPYGWIIYKGKCYYFSENEKNWTSSQNFCTSHNASLAIIDEQEMKFLMRNTERKSSWIGLRRDLSKVWKWVNKANSTLRVDGEGGNCAYITDGKSASASRCSNPHNYICSKLDASQKPQGNI